MSLFQQITKTFTQIYGNEPHVFRSPGRINLIGEHTDYNNGFVLPAAIDKFIYVALSLRNDHIISLYSVKYDEHYEVAISDIKPTGAWHTYILGVVDVLKQLNLPLKGFNMVIDGDLPVGSGISSSAALESAVAFALSETIGLLLPRMELAKIAQKAEHTFAGVNCGIMDMFASLMSKKGHAIRLDCRSLDYEYVPLELGNYKIVLLNSNVKHNLASSEYNIRRQQCEEGIRLIKNVYPEVNSLRDADLAIVDEILKDKDALIYKRCKYVIEENLRLLKSCEALVKGDLHQLGTYMYQSHQGLSEEYEVSCPELDVLVDLAKSHASIIGSRMMGGGFGGCTINLIHNEGINDLVEKINEDYLSKTSIELTPIIVDTSDGTNLIAQKSTTHAR